MLEIRNVASKGRGVFAQKRFAPGELIEQAPVIVLPNAQVGFLDQTLLKDYYYHWDDASVALALGFGSLYNHAYAPNAHYVKSVKEVLIKFVALRTIEVGEEITVNYNGDPTDQAALWFAVID